VALLNDLEANAYGLAMLAPDDFVALNNGTTEASGNMAIIAAGTGLGEAGLHWDGGQHHPFASEGGHASFAPSNAFQIELLSYLLREFTHVSWERVVSGPGLYNIYRFLRDTGRGEEPPWLGEEIRRGDPAAVISQAALAGSSALCGQALDLFIALYGAEAGNLALKLMASGGVFVGGGIAPKIITKLRDSTFIEAFVAKGRMQSLLQDIPVRVILNDKAALLGAARFAALPGSKWHEKDSR
jgi:glucokinase